MGIKFLTICDRCGASTTVSGLLNGYKDIYLNRNIYYTVCGKCFKSFKKWIREEEEED